ncbi:MAG TPA: hypothetical protein VL329_11910 [Nitrospiraceae bacterium]|jgi:integrin beta 3|nr:hypothetical protein [Nitrospiraceae bacterium]
MTKSADILGRQMLSAVRGYVSRALLSVSARLDEFERRLSTIPAGPQGPEGQRGEAGKAGDTGPIGPPGVNGKDGTPGKDALEIEPINSIDTSRSYQRGTWARYNGGIIRAIRETDPIDDGNIAKAGWVVMWNGLAAVVITRNEANVREVSVASVMTDGTRAISTMSMPFVIYRGIYKASQAYAQGDSVTHDGSTWICLTGSTRAVPGKSDDWQLAVKRGSDGKHGKDGPEGPKGDPGMDLRFK